MTSARLYGSAGGVVSASTQAGLRDRTRRVFQYRRILGLLIRRDLRVRYAGSVLGYLWTILDPLMMSMVFWFIFTQIFKRDNPNEHPYILFIVIGQLTFQLFQGGTLAAAKSLRGESAMVRSSNVPRELWVLRTVCSKFVEFFFALPVIALFAIAYLVKPNKYLLLMPLGWLLVFLLLCGLGMMLAPLNVLVRDTDRLVPIILRVMFYLSPIFYSIEDITHRVPEIGVIYGFNPMVGPLALMRGGLFPSELDWAYIWHSMVLCVVIFFVGLFVFMRLERPVLKEI